MEGQLKNKTILTSESGNKYEIVSLLGAGGQGEVYDVKCGNHLWEDKTSRLSTKYNFQKSAMKSLALYFRDVYKRQYLHLPQRDNLLRSEAPHHFFR